MNTKRLKELKTKSEYTKTEEKITVKEYCKRKGIKLPNMCGFFGHKEPYYGS